ncbi:Hsp20/alpha crystallin family protein [Halorubrum gandharaense]
MPRRDPFREIEELFERMGREFEEFGSDIEPAVSNDVNVDVAETDDELVVTADLPGFERDEIDVELREDALTIAASHTETVEEEEAGEEGEEPHYHRRERRQRAVSRRIPLPAPVDAEATTAEYDNGVLTVTLPKQSPEKSDGHSIDVN